ncbi:MAG: hypothetical protein SGBAC_010510 [Bacillariaceae sp.]
MVPSFTTKVALSALLLLSISQKVRSQSLSLRQGAGDENRGSAIGLINNGKPPPPYAFANQELRKSHGDFPQMTSNRQYRQLQDDDSVWVHAATFPLTANGWSHSLSGDGTFLAAGDYRRPVTNDYDRNSNSNFSNNGDIGNGSVRFFRKDEQGTCGLWNELTNLTLFGNSAGDNFGYAISLSKDGRRVAIGAIGPGSVTVYEMVEEAWALMEVILVDSLENRSGHTISLSKDGSRLVIGDRHNGQYPGNGRVYEWDGSSFLKLGGEIDGELSARQSGSDIALSEDGLVVAIGTLGFVRVFEWSGGSWTKRGLNLDGGSDEYSTWVSVALSGDGNMVASALYHEVQVFEWKDTEWIQVGQTLKAASGERQFGFGFSVSLSSSGDMLAVGLSGSDGAAPKVYTLADETWVELGGGLLGGGDFEATKVSLSSDGSTLGVAYLGLSDFVSVYNFNELLDPTTPTCRPTPSAISGPPSGPTGGLTSPPTAVPPSGLTMAPTLGPTSQTNSGPSGGLNSPQTATPLAGPTMAPSLGPTSPPNSESPSFEPSTTPTSGPTSGCTGNHHWGLETKTKRFLRRNDNSGDDFGLVPSLEIGKYASSLKNRVI